MASDTPLVVPCAADPHVETALRCGRCDTPICPRCLIMTPVGARCRPCARLRTNPLYDVRPLHYLRALAAGLVVALFGGLVAQSIPFLGLLALMFVGWFTGEAVSAAANRKRGTGLVAVAVVATLFGTLAGPALLGAASLPAALPLDARLTLALFGIANSLASPLILFLLLAAVLAASRVR